MRPFITHRTTGSRAKLALLLLGSVAGALSVGTSSAATVDSNAPSLSVRYSEQSLTTDAGVNQLYRRIVNAARHVCPEASIVDLQALNQVEACRKQAVARAIQQINNSQLMALNASRTKSG